MNRDIFRRERELGRGNRVEGAQWCLLRVSMVRRVGLVGALTAGLLLSGCEKESAKAPLSTRAPEMEKKVVSEKPVPEHPDIAAIRQEIGEGAGKYDSIRRRLYALPPELTGQDASTLLVLMMQPQGELWSELGWAAIVNDGFNVLRELRKPLPELPGKLLECFREESRPLVLRDYALQHMGLMLLSWYRNPVGTPLLQNADQREEILQAVKKAATEEHTSLAGTAFNAIDGILRSCRSSGKTPPLSEEELTSLGKRMALSPQVSEHTRISALGFLGSRRCDAALPEARQLMKEQKTPILLRAAAIHYLGLFAQEDDRSYFESLATSSDMRLSFPAQNALKVKK